MKKRNHLLLWLVLFPLLAIAAVYTVVSANQNFSTDIFLTYLSQVQPVWLAAAVGCTLCYIFWEGLSLHTICRRLDSPSRLGRGVVWSAADIFFSAVTPSATGGQPASAWYMLRAGVPGSVCSVALLLNLVLYTLSILVIAPIAIALCPGVLATFCLPARWFIVVGAVLQLALAGLFLLLLVRPGLVERIALWCLNLLSRGRLRLRAEQWRAALAKKMPEYRACTQVLRRDWRLLAAAVCCNVLQRLSLLLVPVCLLLGSAGSPQQALRAAAIQACIILGSNAAPLPGAMGVADFLFLDGYGHLTQDPVSMELASRGISFYGCFLLCGLILLAGVLASGIYRKRENP